MLTKYGLDSFGTSAKKEEFVLPPNLQVFLSHTIILFSSYLIIPQTIISKDIKNPLGPGDFSRSRLHIAFFIYSSFMGLLRSPFSRLEIINEMCSINSAS
jgi:hypothetical protein